MARPAALAALLVSVLFLVALARLGRLEAGGPWHRDLELPGDVPATLYLPAAADPDALSTKPRGERPPGVVLAHGFAGDRAGTSVLARRIASAGYVVLAFDFRGHGANRTPFAREPDGANLFEDVAAAVDALRASTYADGFRIALVGHSMGANAVLRFAEQDSGVDATVLLAGGLRLTGPYRPPNALFIFAEDDFPPILERSPALAAKLAGVESLERGRVAGDFARGTAVAAVEVAGTDHFDILFSAEAAAEIVRWLDRAFEIERPGSPPTDEPRLRAAAVAGALLPLVLFAVGSLIGRLAPAEPAAERGAAPLGLLWLVLALLATLPLLAVSPTASFLALVIADTVAAWLAYAGILLLAGLRRAGRRILPEDPGASLAPAFLGFAAVYALMAPLGVVVHRLTPTPERALATLGTAVLMLPFFLAFETLLRRGAVWQATLLCVAGRIVILAALVLGIATGVLSPVVATMIGPFGVVFLLVEALALGVYRGSKNPLVIALIESLWLAWVIALVMPIS